jgi:hypothetical protein
MGNAGCWAGAMGVTGTGGLGRRGNEEAEGVQGRHKGEGRAVSWDRLWAGSLREEEKAFRSTRWGQPDRGKRAAGLGPNIGAESRVQQGSSCLRADLGAHGILGRGMREATPA